MTKEFTIKMRLYAKISLRHFEDGVPQHLTMGKPQRILRSPRAAIRRTQARGR